MKQIILAAILLTLASCASQPQQPADSQWGKWNDPNYVRNEYTVPDVARTTGVTPITVNVGWSRKR